MALIKLIIHAKVIYYFSLLHHLLHTSYIYSDKAHQTIFQQVTVFRDAYR